MGSGLRSSCPHGYLQYIGTVRNTSSTVVSDQDFGLEFKLVPRRLAVYWCGSVTSTVMSSKGFGFEFKLFPRRLAVKLVR